MTRCVIPMNSGMALGDQATRLIWEGWLTPTAPENVQVLARRKLRLLNNVCSLEDIRAIRTLELSPPASRHGRYRIRISRGWWLAFRWHKSGVTHVKRLPNIHPGKILHEDFMLPWQISQNALARAAGVPPRRINEIVLGKRGISADTAIRLSEIFGMSERFWFGLQADYDLEEARMARAAPKAERADERRASCFP